MASNSSVEFTWDTLADLTLQAASWTTNYMHCKNASPGIWQSRATARTKTRFSLAWQANGMLESFVSGFEWAKSSRVVFLCFGRSKGNAVGWPRILEARRQLGFNGLKSAVFARVGFLPSSFRLRQKALLAPLHGLFHLALQVICPIWWTYPCSPTAFHAFPYFPCLVIIEIMMPMGAAPWHRENARPAVAGKRHLRMKKVLHCHAATPLST